MRGQGQGRGRGHSPDRNQGRGGGRAGRRDREPDAEPDLGPEADPESVARTIVLTKLTAQARTRAELSEALRKKQVPIEVAESVLDRMAEVGLVDDAAFAESWVSSRQARRHLSRTALRQELVRKGVERDEIDTALEQVGPEDEYRAALELAEKKARSTSGLDRQVRYRRLVGALARKGFGSEICRRVIAEVLNGTEGEAEDDAEPLG